MVHLDNKVTDMIISEVNVLSLKNTLFIIPTYDASSDVIIGIAVPTSVVSFCNGSRVDSVFFAISRTESKQSGLIFLETYILEQKILLVVDLSVLDADTVPKVTSLKTQQYKTGLRHLFQIWTLYVLPLCPKFRLHL